MSDKNTFEKLKSINNIIVNSKLTAFIVPFICVSAYYVYLIITQSLPFAQGYYEIHYLYTYNHGFISRGLVGEVLSLFFDKITPEITKYVIFGFSVFLIAAASLCIGSAVNRAKSDKDRWTSVIVLIIVACILPVSFRVYLMDIKLDKILWALTLLAVFLTDKKVGIWFTPLLCIIAVLVNPVFLFCSMLLIAVILLQLFYESKYSVKNGIICLLSYVSMAAVGLLSALSEKFVGFSDPYQMADYYFSRSDTQMVGELRQKFGEEYLFDFFEPLNKVLKLSFDTYFTAWGLGKDDTLNFVFLTLPLYIVLFVFWKKAMSHEENKFQKFIFIICIISPILTIMPILLSWEASKYFGNNMLAQLCLIIYFISHNNKAVVSALKDFKQSSVLMLTALIGYFALFIKEIF
jgi:hypothetical protein